MIRQTLKYGRSYAAIEHAEKERFTILQLAKKKKEFIISRRRKANNIAQGIEFLKGQKHVFLVVNDEQVLSKSVAFTNEGEKILIRNAFPNISLTDFYYQVYQSNTHSFVCIARKDKIDEIISTYHNKGISVIDFSLGNLALKNIQSFVTNKILFSSNAQVEFERDLISNIEKKNISEENYLINDLEVSNNELLPLGGIISYYAKNESSILHKKLNVQYLHKRFFDLGLKTSLGFLLVLLLSNFFLFSSYRNKVGDLIGELQLSETYKNQLNKLQEEVKQKKRLVKSVQSASNSKLSKYLDDLGESTPKTLLLSQIHFQPIIGIQKIDKPLLFKTNEIVVKGVSKENEEFTNWISFLEQKNWIKNISIHEYGKGKKTGSNSAFEFIITTHDR